MKRIFLYFIVVGIIVINVSISAQNKKFNTPKTVTEAFSKTYPNGKILTISKEKVSGKIQYEVESMDGATRRDLIYDDKGNVLEFEEVVANNELPKIITDYISKNYSKAKLITAEKLFANNVMKYEIGMKQGKKKFSLTFDDKGQLEKKWNLF